MIPQFLLRKGKAASEMVLLLFVDWRLEWMECELAVCENNITTSNK